MSHFRLLSLICLTLTILPLSIGYATAAQTRGEVTGTISFETPDWFKASFLDIAEDAVEAGDEDKHVLIFFHLEDCPYCAHMLEENFRADPNMSYIQEHFDCIELNVKGAREVALDENTTMPENELARHLKVGATPAIMMITPENELALRVNGYRSPEAFRTALEFVQTRSYESQTLAEFEAARSDINYTFREHPLFKEATDLQALSDKPLAVVFEDRNCTDCDEVHDNLFNREDSLAALSNFNVIRLDALSEEPITLPDGRTLSPKDWFKELELTYRPSVLFFDKGEQLIRIDNRLYSWYFTGFANWVGERHHETMTRREYFRNRQEEWLASGKNVSHID